MIDCSWDAPPQDVCVTASNKGNSSEAKKGTRKNNGVQTKSTKDESGKVQNDSQSKRAGVDGLQILSQICYFSIAAYRSQSDFLYASLRTFCRALERKNLRWPFALLLWAKVACGTWGHGAMGHVGPYGACAAKEHVCGPWGYGASGALNHVGPWGMRS